MPLWKFVFLYKTVILYIKEWSKHGRWKDLAHCALKLSVLHFRLVDHFESYIFQFYVKTLKIYVHNSSVLHLWTKIVFRLGVPVLNKQLNHFWADHVFSGPKMVILRPSCTCNGEYENFGELTRILVICIFGLYTTVHSMLTLLLVSSWASWDHVISQCKTTI